MTEATVEDGLQRNGAVYDRRQGQRRPSVVRLHLVRHGETEANRENLVLGQRESPLTEKGINQARALGRSLFQGKSSPPTFWRAYCSDYERTRITANTILNGGSATNDVKEKTGDSSLSVAKGVESSEMSGGREATGTLEAVTTETTTVPTVVIPDKRLRERAKGVREGRPKSLTYKEALALYYNEKKDIPGVNGESENLPLLESDDDVWNRVKSWIDEVVRDACGEDDGGNGGEDDESSDVIESESKRRRIVETSGIEKDQNADFPAPEKVRDVIAVSHSATIRTTLNRLVGSQLPSDVSTNPVGDDGQTKGMLIVPNTSRTIVDIVIEEAKRSLSKEDSDRGDEAAKNERGETPKWSARLVDLTNTDHLSMLPP